MSHATLSAAVLQLLMPPAPLVEEPELEGYVAVTLDTAGGISVRGSRVMLAWLLARLAAQGWRIELDQIRWCG